MKPAIRLEDLLRVYPAAATDREARRGAVLDVVFDVLLKRWALRGIFAVCSLVFKGGTALRKFHLGHEGRFSFDLDFDTVEPVGTVIEFMRDALSDLPVGNIVVDFDDSLAPPMLRVWSDLLADGETHAKLDFSPRGLWVPAEEMSPIATPLHRCEWADPTFRVPVIDLHDNLAEKLCRWRSTQLIRDLADLALLLPRITNYKLVATLYVATSYHDWLARPADQRHATPATTLAETLETCQTADFDLRQLVLPQHTTEAQKTVLTRHWLQSLRRPLEAIDTHIRHPSLQTIANSGDHESLYLTDITVQAATAEHFRHVQG